MLEQVLCVFLVDVLDKFTKRRCRLFVDHLCASNGAIYTLQYGMSFWRHSHSRQQHATNWTISHKKIHIYSSSMPVEEGKMNSDEKLADLFSQVNLSEVQKAPSAPKKTHTSRFIKRSNISQRAARRLSFSSIRTTSNNGM